MPTPEQKELIKRHEAALESIMNQTPCEDARHSEQTLTAVGKMMMVLPSRDAGELAGLAKGEAYMAALDDVPSWAVQEAIRRWYRSECGDQFDYKWQPGPATLREVSMNEVYRVMGIQRTLRKILIAETLMDFSSDHTETMKLRLVGIAPSIKSMDA